MIGNASTTGGNITGQTTYINTNPPSCFVCKCDNCEYRYRCSNYKPNCYSEPYYVYNTDTLNLKVGESPSYNNNV